MSSRNSIFRRPVNRDSRTSLSMIKLSQTPGKNQSGSKCSAPSSTEAPARHISLSPLKAVHFSEQQPQDPCSKVTSQDTSPRRSIAKKVSSPSGFESNNSIRRIKSRSSKELWNMVKQALKDGAKPSLTTEGCGGAYIIERPSSHAGCAIFKPRTEEYMGPENPRGYQNESAIVGQTPHPVQRGFCVGNGALMERAAYVLDRRYGSFSGVPVTQIAEIPVGGIKKEGSLQHFVPSESSAEDFGTACFDVSEVHKIAILDIRLFNTDRHSGNILVTSKNEDGKWKMVPIDHGLCLPAFTSLAEAQFEWLRWPQAKASMSDTCIRHIKSLNTTADAQVLRELGIDENNITTMRVCTELLKQGAIAGLTPQDLGTFLMRHGDSSEPSVIEALIDECLCELELKHESIRDKCAEIKREIGDKVLVRMQDKISSIVQKNC